MTTKTHDEPAKAAPKAVEPQISPIGPFPPSLASINEPVPTPHDSETPPAPELPPLVLTSVTPDTHVIGPETEIPLTIAGDGFDATCLVVFDDADLPTSFVSATELTAIAPMGTVAGVVDVEVARGEETSDVLVFEWTAVAGRRTSAAARKPKKETPAHKRLKKGKR
jgi:hypothetical protein